MSLSNDLKNSLKRLLHATESLLLGPLLVRLYATKGRAGGEWEEVSPSAALSLVVQRGDTTRLLVRAYDLSSGETPPGLCVDVEAYTTLRAAAMTKLFYVLEVEACLLGVDFAAEAEVNRAHGRGCPHPPLLVSPRP